MLKRFFSDDQFVYANDRYKMAGQWFALPKLFADSRSEGYQIVVNERGLIQFRNEHVSFSSSLSFSLAASDLLCERVELRYSR